MLLFSCNYFYKILLCTFLSFIQILKTLIQNLSLHLQISWVFRADFGPVMLLAREAKALKVLFFLPTSSQILPIFSIFLFSTILNYFQWFFSIFSKFASLIDCLKGLSARKAKAQSKCTFFFFFQPLLKFLLIFSIFFFTNFKLFSVIF